MRPDPSRVAGAHLAASPRIFSISDAEVYFKFDNSPRPRVYEDYYVVRAAVAPAASEVAVTCWPLGQGDGYGTNEHRGVLAGTFDLNDDGTLGTAHPRTKASSIADEVLAAVRNVKPDGWRPKRGFGRTVADWLLAKHREFEAGDREVNSVVRKFLSREGPKYPGLELDFDTGATFGRRLAFVLLHDINVYSIYYDVASGRVEVIDVYGDRLPGMLQRLVPYDPEVVKPDPDDVEDDFRAFLQRPAPRTS